MAISKETGYVVSHTHWDRAWYITFEEFRFRLVDLIDSLLDLLEKRPEFKCFALDGQTVLLEDYLQIRPENREKLSKFIKEKRIMVGPWYVLPDEFLVSGEALIRNLMVGHEVADGFGNVSKIGYVPDPFGHIAQLPQILNGFGIDNFIFSRGMGDEGETLGSEFRWKGMDGNSEVIAVWQVTGYGNARALGFDEKHSRFNMKLALKQIQQTYNDISPFAHVPFRLFNNGIDHIFPQKEIPEILKTWNKTNSNLKLIQSPFETYISKIRKYKNKFPNYTGELRGQKYHWLLPGVLSSRVYLKTANHDVQSTLERWAEPMSAIAHFYQQAYPQAFLEYAWKKLLKNHPHDDICGCSIDEVHEDMVNRFKRSKEVSEKVVNISKNKIIDSIDTLGPEGALPIIIFNTSGCTLNSVLNNYVSLPVEYKKELMITDRNGKKLSGNVTFGGEIQGFDGQLFKKIKAGLSALVDIPAFGYKTVYLKPMEKIEIDSNDSDDDFCGQYPLLVTNKSVENKYYRLTFEKNGTFNIESKKPDISLKGLGFFEDNEDVGDEYDYSPAPKGKKLTTKSVKADINLLDSNPLSAAYEIRIPWQVPEKINSKRTKRSKRSVKQNIITRLFVYATTPRIDIETTIDNAAKDHKVKVLFPTSILSEEILAGDSFCAVRRPVRIPVKKDWVAASPAYHPFKGYVSIPGKFNGLALMAKGLLEYEAISNNEGVALALTLFRSVGWLSRNDLATRSNDAGPSIETPEAQCLKKMKFEYSIMVHPHLPNLESFLSNAVLQYEGTRSFSTDRHKGKLPDWESFIEIENPNLVLSAVKKSEKGNGLIIRVYNPSGGNGKSKIKVWKTIKKAVLVRLDEKIIPKGNLKIYSDNTINLDVKSNSIVTMKLTF